MPIHCEKATIQCNNLKIWEGSKIKVVRRYIEKLFYEFNKTQDEGIREKVINVWVKALEINIYFEQSD